MHEQFYKDLSKSTGRDVRQIKRIAHHPFGFYFDRIKDDKDNRPMRLPYLGAFHVKLVWKKGMKYAPIEGYPEEGKRMYARVKFKPVYKEKYGIYLRAGVRVEDEFLIEPEGVKVPIEDVFYWVYSDGLIE